MIIELFDHGYVELLRLFGDDFTPVESARVSFDGKLYDNQEKNIKLLDYLYKNGHLSTTEHIVFTFRIKAPIFVVRQWFRHRLASVNERSLRYSVFTDDYYVPDQARYQDEKNKQGSFLAHNHELSCFLRENIVNSTEESIKMYKNLLASGIAREQARIVLPVNIYTEFMWTVNLRSLMNFLTQRLDNHAQYEIREYANAISHIFGSKLPYNKESFTKYWVKNV
jgi:thymidylate synthase (FAD)